MTTILAIHPVCKNFFKHIGMYKPQKYMVLISCHTFIGCALSSYAKLAINSQLFTYILSVI